MKQHKGIGKVVVVAAVAVALGLAWVFGGTAHAEGPRVSEPTITKISDSGISGRAGSGDGTVDLQDLNNVRNNFGATGY